MGDTELLAAQRALSPGDHPLAIAIDQAASWFEGYANNHAAKGTADGDLKAQTNRERAAYLRASLNTRTPPAGDTVEREDCDHCCCNTGTCCDCGASIPIIRFTPEEVMSLNAFQADGRMHGFTCGNDHPAPRTLIATCRGWICPCCDYTQDWAHDWMLDWEWKEKLDEQFASLNTRTPPTGDAVERASRAISKILWGVDRYDEGGLFRKQTDEMAIAALSTPTPAGADQWQPIETAPKDGTWVWAFWPVQATEDQQRPSLWVKDDPDGPRWQDAADHIDWTQPTHWQPLPAPPTFLSEQKP